MADYSIKQNYYATKSEGSSLHSTALHKIRNPSPESLLVEVDLKRWFHDDIYLWKFGSYNNAYFNTGIPTKQNTQMDNSFHNNENAALPGGIWNQFLYKKQQQACYQDYHPTAKSSLTEKIDENKPIGSTYLYSIENSDNALHDNESSLISNKKFAENNLFERIDFYHLIQTNSHNHSRKFRKYTTRYEILIDPEHIVLYQISKRLIGAKGCNMKRINSNTGAKLRLRGIGSGYYEGNGRKEARERLHLCVSAPTNAAFAKTCVMVENLLVEVATHYRRLLSGEIDVRDDLSPNI